MLFGREKTRVPAAFRCCSCSSCLEEDGSEKVRVWRLLFIDCFGGCLETLALLLELLPFTDAGLLLASSSLVLRSAGRVLSTSSFSFSTIQFPGLPMLPNPQTPSPTTEKTKACSPTSLSTSIAFPAACSVGIKTRSKALFQAGSHGVSRP